MIYLLMRTGPLEARCMTKLFREIRDHRAVLVYENALAFVHKLMTADGRRYLAFAETLHFLGVCLRI